MRVGRRQDEEIEYPYELIMEQRRNDESVDDMLRALEANAGSLSTHEEAELIELRTARSSLAQVGRCDHYSGHYVHARIEQLHQKLPSAVTL